MEAQDLVGPNPQETMDKERRNLGVVQIGTTGEYLGGTALPQQVNPEPEEHCWEACENYGDKPVKMKEEVLDNVSPEVWHQRFRNFCYEEAKGPRDVCLNLWELCYQWLRPETNTKEQILESLILEQFLAILPPEMQSWVRDQDPKTCTRAVALAEHFRHNSEEPEQKELESLTKMEEQDLFRPKSQDSIDKEPRNLHIVQNRATRKFMGEAAPPYQVEEEPGEQCWETYKNSRDTPVKVKVEVMEEDCVGSEVWRQRFRRFCYEEAEGPQEVFITLWELCCQWLRPEMHTKERILEFLMLEQFLAVLPPEMQSWVREQDPETCARAVALAERFLHNPEEPEQKVSETSEKVFSSPMLDRSSSEIQWTHLPRDDKPEADWESIFSESGLKLSFPPDLKFPSLMQSGTHREQCQARNLTPRLMELVTKMEEKVLGGPNPQETMDEKTRNPGVQIGITGEYLKEAASSHQVKQKPGQQCWEAYENCLDLPVKVKEEVLEEDSPKVWHQRFRLFCYKEADGPQEVCIKLWELCRQWLRPETHTKDQILESVILEQFLTILPPEMQGWVMEQDPKTCTRAVALAEHFLCNSEELEQKAAQPYHIKQEPEEQCWETYKNSRDSVKEEVMEEVSVIPKVWRQRFRLFCYEEAKGPQEVCIKLWELCSQWLRPEMHTKEQILDFLMLEQFLAILPPEMQSWVREQDPETCTRAVALAERFLQDSEEPEQKVRLPANPIICCLIANQHLCEHTVAPKQKKVEKKCTREVITYKVKKEIIEKHEQGMRVFELARLYKKSPSTICTILKKKAEIMGQDVSKGVTKMSKKRPHILEDVEKLLLVWINEKQLAGGTVTENCICEKAKALYTDLISKEPGMSADKEEGFKASRGWFDKFKKRSGIHSVVRHGEAASSGAEAAEAFAIEFQELMDSQSYLPEQVFNCDETGLFWKKMPKRTYITEEESAMPGPKPMNDHLTLLFCANASGDFKVKPLVVYHSENPQAFKKYKVQKSQLSVMWRSNSKAWVTRILFIEWINEVFGPAVKKYLIEKNLPVKALLIMDSAPAHPPRLEDDLLEEFQFIKVKFLPPNTTPFIQPMDQQVITNFKKLYTKALLQQCFEVTEGSNITLREFWKNNFNIVSALEIISHAWNGVTQRTLNSAWRNLWPACVLGHDLEGLPHEQEPTVVDKIVSLGKIMGLEVNEEDIQELVEEHNQELTTDELMELHREQEVMETSSTQEEKKKAKETPTSNEIREMCRMWEKMQNFVEKYHPNKAVAMRAMNLFNDNAMSHFHEILKRRQKQVSLDGFLVKVARKEKDSLKPIVSSDLFSDSKSRPTH